MFIEFYSVEEADLVLRACQAPDFLVYGERIHATFSKKRSQREVLFLTLGRIRSSVI